jgi:hypothetical protein
MTRVSLGQDIDKSMSPRLITRVPAVASQISGANVVRRTPDDRTQTQTYPSNNNINIVSPPSSYPGATVTTTTPLSLTTMTPLSSSSRRDESPLSPSQRVHSEIKSVLEASMRDAKKVVPGFPLVPHQRTTPTQIPTLAKLPEPKNSGSETEAIVTAVLTRDAGSRNAWPSPRGEMYVRVRACIYTCA